MSGGIGIWHAARAQEKIVRGMISDHRKRSEKRREFYEKNRGDPHQLLRIYGNRCQLHIDERITMPGKNPDGLMPWQGNGDNMIDRFDVRADMDFIPEYEEGISDKIKLSDKDAEDEERAQFERYRAIVECDFAGMTEEEHLARIEYEEDLPIKKEDEKKKKEKKAEIGFRYEDNANMVPLGKKKQKEDDAESESEDEDDAEPQPLKEVGAIDVRDLKSEQEQILDGRGDNYGIKGFVRLLRLERREQDILDHTKKADIELLTLGHRRGGRKNREREKDDKILKPLTRTSPVRQTRSPSPLRRRGRSRSPSSSRSPSPRRRNKKEYLTEIVAPRGTQSDDDDEESRHLFEREMSPERKPAPQPLARKKESTDGGRKKLTPLEKLKKRMQQQFTKQIAVDSEKQKQKKEQKELEQLERDIELQKAKARSSRGLSPRRSRSPVRRHSSGRTGSGSRHSRSPSPTRHRSRSRSRSRTPPWRNKRSRSRSRSPARNRYRSRSNSPRRYR
eukprot:Colp12_sorted_trinity150504_noHs@21876